MRVSFFKSSQSLSEDIFLAVRPSKKMGLEDDQSFPLLKNGVPFSGIYQWFTVLTDFFGLESQPLAEPFGGFLSPEVVDEPSYASARLVDDEGSALTTWAANCRTGFRSIQAENTDCNLAFVILLMEEILHQLIGSLSHYLQGFIHPRWCRISSINRITWIYCTPPQQDVKIPVTNEGL